MSKPICRESLSICIPFQPLPERSKRKINELYEKNIFITRVSPPIDIPKKPLRAKQLVATTPYPAASTLSPLALPPPLSRSLASWSSSSASTPEDIFHLELEKPSLKFDPMVDFDLEMQSADKEIQSLNIERTNRVFAHYVASPIQKENVRPEARWRMPLPAKGEILSFKELSPKNEKAPLNTDEMQRLQFSLDEI